MANKFPTLILIFSFPQKACVPSHDVEPFEVAQKLMSWNQLGGFPGVLDKTIEIQHNA